MKKNTLTNTITESNRHRVIAYLFPKQPKSLGSFSIMLVFTLFLSINISGINAFAEPVPENKQSVRSITVNYDDQISKQKLSKYALGMNEAQQLAFDAVSQLDTSQITRKSREQVIAERKLAHLNKKNDLFDALDSNNSKTENAKSEAIREYLEFDIYSAHSRLFEDNDSDGYYQSFSVSFDADVYGAYAGQRARVFADLYLSRNGGPWELYFTTEPFTIFDDTEEDEFEVLTTLDLGFSTQHYDVLIDLYEVGYSDIVATVSGEQLDSLYALPLESADRDIYVVETVTTSVSIGAGSFSSFMIILLFIIIVLRNVFNSRV